MPNLFEFWIDVGGTFTDCLMKSPDGRLSTFKVLSSGITKGRITEITSDRSVRDDARVGDSSGFWNGYTLRLLDDTGTASQTFRVAAFDSATGTFTLDASLVSSPMSSGSDGTQEEKTKAKTEEPLTLTLSPQSRGEGTGVRYELSSGEEAPILAIRTALGLRLDEAIPPVTVLLGTTRGTNALLTRRGAKVGFVTTKGFRDVLLIANQDRPRLFDLAIQKPEPLIAAVAEIDERLDAAGRVLVAPDESAVREQLLELKTAGCESLAICLLHAFANPAHEQIVERIAREVGFTEISTSSRLSPLIKIVSRGDTTVMDAYVNPILRDYVGTLRESLAGSDERKVTSNEERHSSADSDSSLVTRYSLLVTSLKLMTSAGGLVDADRFTGKDSVLSGPAGGVIGFSRVARRAGFAKSIGFDMGGTSTDVSRFDGRYEREFETTKAGVRVVAPMLAIETVAAGGGSVCGFDGVKLFVGPQSAGADPGPACYGRGGPLTITDVNFFLGKIIPERFPFPLDRAAVETRLSEMCERVATSPLGRSYSPHELAQGFIDIANTTMARAIRKISVSKGYDPAEYALVTFGGAGAQHACALAKSLGMTTVLSHPYAGVLSAYGIGLADVRQLRERGVLRPFSPELLAELEPVFDEMAHSARDDVLAEGIPTERIDAPIRSLDVSYRGVEAFLNVIEPSDGDYARVYAERHQQLYGYTRPERPLEIVAARIEVVGRKPDPIEPSEPEAPREPQPYSSTEAWFDGQPHHTAIFLREQLHPGDHFSGPAIVCEPTSTVVIDPGFAASIRGRGEIVIVSRELRVESQEPEQTARSTSPHGSRLSTLNSQLSADPIRIEIFNHLFASIAEQMGIALQQTSLSTNVKERLDFSCGIFSATGDLVVNAPHIPVHLGAMSETVRRIIEDNPGMKPGDVFVTNDPYRGGSHLPDVTVITPVHDEATGELMFFTASRAHHAEIGGIVPGSMPPFSKTLADEGVLIRNFRLVEGRASSDESQKQLVGTASKHIAIRACPGGSTDSALRNSAPGSRHAAGSNHESVVQSPLNHRDEPGGEVLRQTLSHEDELRHLLTAGPWPSRSPDDNLADVSAQVAANQTGAAQLRQLVEKHSWPVVRAYMGHIQASATAKMRLALGELSRETSDESREPENTVRNGSPTVRRGSPDPAETPDRRSPSPKPLQHDGNEQDQQEETCGQTVVRGQETRAQQGTVPSGTQHSSLDSRHFTRTDHLDDGSPICVTITITGDSETGGRATVDFTGTGPVLATNLNANRAIVTAAVLYVFRCLIKDDIPLNSGVLEPVTIVLPECLLNPPAHDDPSQCAAIVGGNVETSQRVVDVLLGALGVAAASQGTMNNLTFGDGTFGYYETICGGSGATPDADGADAVHTHMTNTRLTDPEVIERRYPVRIRAFSIRRGSGGAGEHRGGDGIVRQIEFLKPLRVSILSERRGPYAPFGLNGGEPGELGRNSIQRVGSIEIVNLGGKVSLDVHAGDILTMESPGGGGFGLRQA